MSHENLHVRFDSVPYGAVSSIFPVESLPRSAWDRYDAAAERFESASEADVVAVAPESMATGYQLVQRPLTVVSIAELPEEFRTELLAEAPETLGAYSLLVFGRPTDAENHTLREYA
jgi:hypothetical protein